MMKLLYWVLSNMSTGLASSVRQSLLPVNPSSCLLNREPQHHLKLYLYSFTHCNESLMTLFHSDIFLHRDKTFMPQNPAAWSAWNFLGTMDSKLCLTYWLNVLQVHYLYQFYLSESFSIDLCILHPYP